jgi:hypothetical protein
VTYSSHADANQGQLALVFHFVFTDRRPVELFAFFNKIAGVTEEENVWRVGHFVGEEITTNVTSLHFATCANGAKVYACDPKDASKLYDRLNRGDPRTGRGPGRVDECLPLNRIDVTLSFGRGSPLAGAPDTTYALSQASLPFIAALLSHTAAFMEIRYRDISSNDRQSRFQRNYLELAMKSYWIILFDLLVPPAGGSTEAAIEHRIERFIEKYTALVQQPDIQNMVHMPEPLSEGSSMSEAS